MFGTLFSPKKLSFLRRPESPKSLFHLLSGEQPDVTLYRGQIVDVVVTGVTRAGILARLDSGLQAFIPSSCYPDSMSNVGFDEEAPRRDDNAMRPVRIVFWEIW
jgi:hypothetical protein